MKPSFVRLPGVVFFALAVTACAAVSPCKPLGPQSGGACPGVFPSKAFWVVHQLDLQSPLVGKGLFIGVVKAEPRKGAVHAVLMSVEGMVLCDAEYEKGVLKIISAFPPLNDPAFSRGLMADVSFLLLAPEGAPSEQGVDGQGLAVCRWQAEGGAVLETAQLPGGAIRTRLCGGEGGVIKEALASPPFDRGMAARIWLQVFGPSRYTLGLTLIEAGFVD